VPTQDGLPTSGRVAGRTTTGRRRARAPASR
jgi:hypothetical protein